MLFVLLFVLLIVIIIAIYLCYIVNRVTVASIEKLSVPDNLIVPTEAIHDKDFLDLYQEYAHWAMQNGFEADTLFLAYTLLEDKPLRCSAWWSTAAHTWLVLYVYNEQKFICDFFTALHGANTLTTSSGRDALILPVPKGVYKQAFTGLNLQSLYLKHQQGLDQLAQIYPVISHKPNVVGEMIAFLKRESAFIKTLHFWRHRGVFWFLFRRNFLLNKPLKI